MRRNLLAAALLAVLGPHRVEGAPTRPLPGLHLPRAVSDQTLDAGLVDLPARVRTLRTRQSPPETLRAIVEHLDLRGWRSSPGQPGLRPETKDGAFRLTAYPAGAGAGDAACTR